MESNNTSRSIALISIATAALVIFLAGCAFVLSYNALRHLALENGMTPWLSHLFPLVIDGFIIVASLSVVRASLLSERVVYPLVLVGVFVVLSTVFNVNVTSVADADNVWLARVVAAVPPLALFLSFEILMSQLRNEVARRDIVASVDSLARQKAQIDAELTHVEDLTRQAQARHQAALDEMAAKRKALRDELSELAAQRDKGGAAGDTRQRVQARRETVAEMLAQDATVAEIAEAVGMSPRTVQRDIEVIAHQNGRGE